MRSFNQGPFMNASPLNRCVFYGCDSKKSFSGNTIEYFSHGNATMQNSKQPSVSLFLLTTHIEHCSMHAPAYTY